MRTAREPPRSELPPDPRALLRVASGAGSRTPPAAGPTPPLGTTWRGDGSHDSAPKQPSRLGAANAEDSRRRLGRRVTLTVPYRGDSLRVSPRDRGLRPRKALLPRQAKRNRPVATRPLCPAYATARGHPSKRGSAPARTPPSRPGRGGCRGSRTRTPTARPARAPRGSPRPTCVRGSGRRGGGTRSAGPESPRRRRPTSPGRRSCSRSGGRGRSTKAIRRRRPRPRR